MTFHAILRKRSQKTKLLLNNFFHLAQKSTVGQLLRSTHIRNIIRNLTPTTSNL